MGETAGSAGKDVGEGSWQTLQTWQAGQTGAAAAAAMTGAGGGVAQAASSNTITRGNFWTQRRVNVIVPEV